MSEPIKAAVLLGVFMLCSAFVIVYGNEYNSCVRDFKSFAKDSKYEDKEAFIFAIQKCASKF